MTEAENDNKKRYGGKWLPEMARRLLKGKEQEISELPAVPDEKVAESLIGKAADNTPVPPPEPGKKGCPYATKRAIAESLAEIRRFAAEHKLAATAVRAILALLAEMALGALQGKVSGKVLEALLKAANYERDRKEAYSEGEKAGRCEQIEAQLFPEESDRLPDINGSLPSGATPSSIFDIAKGKF